MKNPAAPLWRWTVRRNGKSVGVVDVDVFNEQKALLAIGRATYSTLGS